MAAVFEIKTALELKQVIDKLPQFSTSIGSCLTDILNVIHHNHDLSIESFESECQEFITDEIWKQNLPALIQVEAIRKTERLKSSKFYIGYQKPLKQDIYRIDINYKGKNFTGSLKDLEKSFLDQEFEEWYNVADQAGYGNMRTVSTEFDPEVRVAKEIPSEGFKCSDELLKAVETFWSDHFRPRKVRVEPYKINFYKSGCHFKPHKDTPALDLVGTVIILLHFKGKGQCFKIENHVHYIEKLNCVGFHPSVVHSVEKLGEKDERVTLTFKIYASKDQSNIDECAEDVQKILRVCKAPFGFLLNYQYSFGSEIFQGFDQTLLEALKKLDEIELVVLPVLVKSSITDYSLYWDNRQEDSFMFDLKVYSLDQQIVDQVFKTLKEQQLTQNEKINFSSDIVEKLKPYGKIPFVLLDEKSKFEWSYHRDEGSEWTGNEAKPDSIDSIYISYAAIILPKN